jgi:tRNA dimethylallyltransferase
MLLAARTSSTIISADSRQIYRDFEIGTAKPSAEERAQVPHRGIDVADPTERYSAARWVVDAEHAIDEAVASGRKPIVVGGTGLYLRALFEGLFEEPPLDDGHRRKLQEQLAEMQTDELRRWVQRIDPGRAHLGRTQLVRGVEIALLTGRRVSDLHQENMRAPRWRPRYLLVDPGPSLGERIALRIGRMFDHGWPDEVQRLMQTVPEDAPAWKSTGYGTIRRFVRGELSREKAYEQILIDTRQYAKRQRTWFRNQLPDGVTKVGALPTDGIDGWSVDGDAL